MSRFLPPWLEELKKKKPNLFKDLPGKDHPAFKGKFEDDRRGAKVIQGTGQKKYEDYISNINQKRSSVIEAHRPAKDFTNIPNRDQPSAMVKIPDRFRKKGDDSYLVRDAFEQEDPKYINTRRGRRPNPEFISEKERNKLFLQNTENPLDDPDYLPYTDPASPKFSAKQKEAFDTNLKPVINTENSTITGENRFTGEAVFNPTQELGLKFPKYKDVVGPGAWETLAKGGVAGKVKKGLLGKLKDLSTADKFGLVANLLKAWGQITAQDQETLAAFNSMSIPGKKKSGGEGDVTTEGSGGKDTKRTGVFDFDEDLWPGL